MQLGLDCLGLARFSNAAQEAIPSNYAIGVFSRTFGDAMPAVSNVVKSRGCNVVRVHLMWSDSHSFSDADIPTLTSEAKRWADFGNRHKNVKLFLSPFCEHNVGHPDKYLDLVKKHAPNCEPVNAPWKGGMSGKYINEVHGTDAPAPGGRYIFSFDGDDMLESNIETLKLRHQSAMIWFGWTANFNGVTEVDAAKVPREKRTAWPSNKLVRSVRYVMDMSRGPAILPANWIWKSHAEDTGTGDVRTNKPILIAPIKAKSAELLRAGQVIASAPYYGPFDGGRSRYYFPQWGYEFSQNNGNTILDVSIGGKVYGKVNPAFRAGTYR